MCVWTCRLLKLPRSSGKRAKLWTNCGTRWIVAHIEGRQSSEDLTLGGGEGGVVVGTRQTAAAVMAAEMVAIEGGERAELLLVN